MCPYLVVTLLVSSVPLHCSASPLSCQPDTEVSCIGSRALVCLGFAPLLVECVLQQHPGKGCVGGKFSEVSCTCLKTHLVGSSARIYWIEGVRSLKRFLPSLSSYICYIQFAVPKFNILILVPLHITGDAFSLLLLPLCLSQEYPLLWLASWSIWAPSELGGSRWIFLLSSLRTQGPASSSVSHPFCSSCVSNWHLGSLNFLSPFLFAPIDFDLLRLFIILVCSWEEEEKHCCIFD